MAKDKQTKATFGKSARVISDYLNDLIFEQPREDLLMQEFISYEWTPHGMKISKIKRKFTKDGGYSDSSSSEIVS